MRRLGEESNGLAGIERISHRFFGSVGGTSPDPWGRLNVSFSVGDAPARVEENLARTRFQLGVARNRLFTSRQVHRDTVLEICGGDDPAAVAKCEADGLFTMSDGVGVAVLTADCAPLLIASSCGKAVCAVHAGWRGAVGGVVESAVARFEAHGFQPENLRAAIGPTISQDAFEVGPEVVNQAAAGFNLDGLVVAGTGDRVYFDLPGYVKMRLHHLGVTSVDKVGGCTASNAEEYYSYRRTNGKTGRQLSAIALTNAPEIDPAMFA